MDKGQEVRSCAQRSNARELWAIFVFMFLAGMLAGYAIKACAPAAPPHKEVLQQ